MEIKNEHYMSIAGFTLIEVMVSVGIIAMISVVIVQVFFATTRTNTKTELLKDIKQNADNTLEVMTRMIRSAKSIDSTCSSTGTTSNSLVITNPDGKATTLECVMDGTIARISSSSAGYKDYLTSSNIVLANSDCVATNALSFTCTRVGDQPVVVKISFDLSQKGIPIEQFEKGSASFQTTVTTRN